GGGRVRPGDVVYFVLFAAFVAGALLLLISGVAAVVASVNPVFHEAMHVRALSDDLVGRLALRVADGAHLVQPPVQVVVDYAFSLLNMGMAGLLLWLRPRDWTARLLAVAMVGTAGAFNLEAQGTYEAVALTPSESAISAVNHLIAGFAYIAALLLFPDGRPVPRWPWPWLVALYVPLAALATFVMLRVTGAGDILSVEGTSRPTVLMLFFGLLVPVTGVLSQAYRFGRSADAGSHQQARLLFWALLPALAISLFFVLTQQVGPQTFTALAGRPTRELPVVAFRVFQPVFALIPVALLVGLLRFRLWDVDRVINRTLVYFMLTAILAAGYWGTVVAAQWTLRPFTRENGLAIAISTLAVAAGFGPLRRRVQTFVDRRYNRSRYDAARTIEEFGHRLRDEIDLESMTDQLRSVVLQTMQPAHAMLWLRPPPRPETNDGGFEGAVTGSVTVERHPSGITEA
ncbi:MAG TPA: hypothetical protein VM840_04285, partial [Actinomycetota bacterium]|nr:hypothetical protein [Actinomycetota bacterium]